MGKYGWDSERTPKLFILVGTPKETQNAVVFDDKQCVDKTLVVKVSLTNISNLENEYVTGSSIKNNQTKYIAFNSDENTVSEILARFSENLNLVHVECLSRLILPDKRRFGAELKYNIIQAGKGDPRVIFDNHPVLAELLGLVGDESIFLARLCMVILRRLMLFTLVEFSKISVIDWENSDLDGFALSDMFNYVYMKDCLFSRGSSSDLDSFLYHSAKIIFHILVMILVIVSLLNIKF